MQASESAPTHLFVLLHGLYGTPGQMAHIRDQILSTMPPGEAAVLVVTQNSTRPTATHDGVAAGGRRAAEETAAFVAARPSLRYLSVVGFSLGGLYSRFMVGLLYEWNALRGTVTSLQPAPGPAPGGSWRGPPLLPVSFLTVATPHLGSPWLSLGRLFAWILGGLLPSTYRQLFLADVRKQQAQQQAQRPLLLEMTSPGSSFMRGLALFHTRTTVAHAWGDLLAPFPTASIRLEEEIYGEEEEEEEEEGEGEEEGEEEEVVVHEMHSNLNTLVWRRVDLPPGRFFLAHIDAVVAYAWLAGADAKAAVAQWVPLFLADHREVAGRQPQPQLQVRCGATWWSRAGRRKGRL